MAKDLPASAVTMFRDLLEQSQDAMFERDFARPGIFVKKVRGERVYWYFRGTGEGKRDVYVGPQDADLLRRIAEHRRKRGDERGRRTLVRMLQRSGLPSTPPAVGAVLEAFAREGVFRHRACLVGTHAFALYGGLLGVRIRDASVATNDIDIAQFRDVSIAISQDERIDLFPILKAIDDSYRPISKVFDEGKHVAFTNAAGNKVEVLSPRQGPDIDSPVPLPSIGAHGHGFRFLDYLLHGYTNSVALFGAGVPVNVPAPERYAVHKLIVAARRRKDAAKAAKDLSQAAQLVAAMWRYQKDDVRFAVAEAAERGPKWREALAASLVKLPLDAVILAELRGVAAPVWRLASSA